MLLYFLERGARPGPRPFTHGNDGHSTVRLQVVEGRKRELLNLGEPDGFEISPWADRIQSVDATYVGTWTLPAIDAVTAPAAVLTRPRTCGLGGRPNQAGLADALTAWFRPPTAPLRTGFQDGRSHFQATPST